MIQTPSAIPIHPDFLELLDFNPASFRIDWCSSSDTKGEIEATKYQNDNEFFARSLLFCYQSIGLIVQGMHRPYIARLLSMTADMGYVSILDFGSGGGQLGLALHALGFRVSFGDLASESIKFVEWRLRKRGLNLPVYVLNTTPGVGIPHQNIVTCFDVLEHLDPGAQIEVLDLIGEIGDMVMVNFVIDSGHPRLHRPIDVAGLVGHVKAKWPCELSDWYPDKDGKPRQHLLLYGSGLRKADDA